MGETGGVKWRIAGKILVGTALLTLTPVLTHSAFAAKIRHPAHTQTASNETRHGHGGSARVASLHDRTKYALKGSKVHYVQNGGPHLQCVSFARAATGIELKGNAANWWDAAAGIYERGSQPEPGSVLNFRSNGHMRLGHVAVVMAVNGSREIEIEHANWAGPGANKGGISRNVPVIDVSANNDWSAVRVGLGRSGDYGSVYPTYGFIYDRADRGVMVANEPTSTTSPTVLAVDELAQATPRRKRAHLLDADLVGDAPSRALR